MKGQYRLFNLDGGITYDISSDGKWISFVANNTEPPYDSLNFDIFLMNIESKKIMNITSFNFQDDSSPYFSKDGRFLFFTSQFDPDYSADNERIMLYDIESGQVENLTENYDKLFFGLTQGENTKLLYTLVEEKAKISLYLLDIKSKKLEKILQGGSINSVNISGNKMYFLKSTLAGPA